MKAYAGDPRFPVWLVADSEPRNWHQLLLTPLDPRHPARHNIWTAVLEYMQEAVYKQGRLRFNAGSLYIRNAVANPDEKPEGVRPNWSQGLRDKVDSLRTDLLVFTPKVILTFGAFAFEFVRRACGEEPICSYSHWGTVELGNEFRKRVAHYDDSKTNLLPLLHVSISRGRFLKSHEYFVGKEAEQVPNYFEYVGDKLAELFLYRLALEPIWVE